MTRSALPTGPCGSSTPSLHDAINIAALVIEIARSHIADALGVPVTSGDIRSGLAACITDSIGIHSRLDMGRNFVEIGRTPQSPRWGGEGKCGQQGNKSERRSPQTLALPGLTAARA